MRSSNTKLEKLQNVIEKYNASEESLIPVLHETQKIFGTITEEAQIFISKELNLPLSKIYSVVTFFSKFSDEPEGEFVIGVCDSAVCRVNGNAKLVKQLEDALKIKMGESTEDGMFSLMYTPCFGACDISPAIRINENVYGNLNEERIQELINAYKEGEYNVKAD